MQSKRVWARVLGVERGVIVERVVVDDDADEITVACRVRQGRAGRCGECGRRCPGYDQGDGRRRWRALDAGTVRVFIAADAPRVSCPEHAVTVALVPWARHGTVPATRVRSMIRWGGWSLTRPRPRSSR